MMRYLLITAALCFISIAASAQDFFPLSDADRIANSDKLSQAWTSVLSAYPFGHKEINAKLNQLIAAIPTIARADLLTRYQYAVDGGRFLGSLGLVDNDPYLYAFRNTLLYAVTGKPSMLNIAGTMAIAPTRTARIVTDLPIVEQALFKKILKFLGLPEVPL